MPIGTVIASLLAPDTFAEMLGRDSSYWALADGAAASTDYFNATGSSNIPDLRGLFLRGINAGRDDGDEDPNGAGRSAGDYQQDEFKSHGHEYKCHSALAGAIVDGSFGVGNNTDLPYVWAGVTAKGGAETRPKNSAVYWYIKVK